MNRTIIAAGVLLLGCAGIISGCQQNAEQGEQAAAPLRTIETSETEQAQVDALVESYLDLRKLLADDQLAGVPEEFAAIGQAAQPLVDSDDAQVAPLAQDLVELAAAEPTDLKNAREAFKGISGTVLALVKIIPPSDASAEALYVAYCPMAKASWLQESEELANPYMGQKMLKCGEIKETIATIES